MASSLKIKEPIDVSQYIPLIAGGVSGVVTRTLCQPLDVIKIRFQLQVEPIENNVESKYKNIHQAVRLIIKEEGLSALWKGHTPAQLLSVIYGVVQFGVYDSLVREAKRYPILADNKAKVEFFCGFTAGCLAILVSSPFDIVRTRQIVQGNDKVYRSTLHGLIHIAQHDGLRGWCRGLTPMFLQIGPLTGIQFASYSFYKTLIKEFETTNALKSKWIALSETALAASMAGFTAKIATYPFDLFKKRLQFQGFQEARKGYGKNFTCSNLLTCFTETVRVEKTHGLFKGLATSLLKASIVNALIFTIYEETTNFLVNFHKVPL